MQPNIPNNALQKKKKRKVPLRKTNTEKQSNTKHTMKNNIEVQGKER